MIKFVDVFKKYNELTALNNINLEIEDGEIFGIVGPSGAGKSTLLRTINKLEEVDGGKIYVNDECVNDLQGKSLRMYRKKVAMIFQHFALLQTKNVYYNIALPLKCKHEKKCLTNENEEIEIKENNGTFKRICTTLSLPFKKIKEKRVKIDKRVKELAEIVGITDKLKNKPSTLSGGEAQRVAIARALALEPEILLCDEATSALDPNTTKQILSLLRKINKTLGITIVLVTHQMEVVKEICERIAIIKDGEILEVGKTEDLFLSSSSALKTLADDKPILPKTGKSIRLFFPKTYTSDSLITRMARELNVDFSIVWGKLEQFGDDVLGSLVINTKDEDFNKIKDYIDKEDVKYEVLESEVEQDVRRFKKVFN